MPTGTATYDPPASSLDLGPFGAVNVYKLVDFEGYQYLPHVRAVSDHWREGPEPGSAQCYYVFDDLMSELIGTPTHFEEVWGLTVSSEWAVHVGDRLVIRQDMPDGTFTLLFDGYAQSPQLDVSSGMERVTFQVLGTPCREWDSVLGGATMRIGDAPDWPGAWDVVHNLNEGDKITDLPTRFNPDGKTNCTLDGDESGPGDPLLWPVFLDPLIVRDPPISQLWSLGRAARYILGKGNPEQNYTDWETAAETIDDDLKAMLPKDADQVIDPDRPATFDLKEIIAPDIDVAGKAWPVALMELIEHYGFSFTWRLEKGTNTHDPGASTFDGGDPIPDWPVWKLRFYRKDIPADKRRFKLQPFGEDLDPARTDLKDATLNLDSAHIVNAYEVDTAPTLYEVAVVLAAGFEVAVDDANKLGEFVKKAESGIIPGGSKYRVWVADETLDGHWDWGRSIWISAAANPDDWEFNWQDVFKEELRYAGETDADHHYATRRRPARHQLQTIDAIENRPLPARLYVITNYDNANVPGIYDPLLGIVGGAGTAPKIQLVTTENTWELLPDRLGIRLTVENPNAWEIGGHKKKNGTSGDIEIDKDAPFKSGKIKVVESLAAPTGNESSVHFDLVLVCTIEGDRRLDSAVSRREASPQPFTINRRDDAKDKYQRRIVHISSPNNGTALPIKVRDDTDVAKQHADGRRIAHEACNLAGTVTIGRLVRSIYLGSAVEKIDGRDVDLRVVLGEGGGEGARYPVVVGMDRTYHPHLATTFHLTDRRAEPVHMGKEGGLRGKLK